MSAIPNRERLRVPTSLRDQLTRFRWRVWTTKIVESLALALAVLLLAYLTLFVIDRVWDTPQSLRMVIFLAALGTWCVVPYAFYYWVYRHRRLDQLARLLRLREPSIGDQLLSVIELAASDGEQARSRTLCAAAMAQVAEVASRRDLSAAAPHARLRMWSITIATLTVIVGLLAIVAPAAMLNAWQRLSAPWRETPRYTFTSIQPLPHEMVVPHGESARLDVVLHPESRWQPIAAQLMVPDHPKFEVQRSSESYQFQLPPLTGDSQVRLTVGDYTQTIAIQPKTRPELIEAIAKVDLPEYLQLPDQRRIDVRSGTLSVVEGSHIQIEAKASRSLSTAAINDRPVKLLDASFQSETVTVSTQPVELKLSWSDQYQLKGRQPFQLAVNPVIDEAPVVSSSDLPRQSVLLESEQVNFSVMASDDFGVKRIGIAWRGLEEESQATPLTGERLIVAGAPNQSSVTAPAVFSAQALGIPAQVIEVRLWCEDYKPGRQRVMSPPHIFYVLTAQQHALWIADQLAKWQRQSMEIRDTELLLNAKNKALRELSAEEREQDKTREELRKQAQAEANNGRKLASLSKQGEALLRKAARNPEIGVGHLERWAEILQILNTISANRMPSVADLLDQASQQKSLAQKAPPQPAAPRAGQDRSQGSGPTSKPPEEVVPSKQAPLPSIVDRESSMQPQEPQQPAGDGPKKKYSGTRFSLPSTTLSGGVKPSKDSDSQPAQEADDEPAIDRALYEQDEILAEFEKIADELTELMANLEGSTFVKRLKAAAREQAEVATKLTKQLNNTFGNQQLARATLVFPERNNVPQINRAGDLLFNVDPRNQPRDPALKDLTNNPSSEPSPVVSDQALEELRVLSERERKGSTTISHIMDDMQNLMERRRTQTIQTIVDEMRESSVVDALRDVADDLHVQAGLTVAQVEFWADTLDRWAEDLVDPANSGKCPGSKSSDALPPSVVLGVLQVLEGEMNLREATRSAEQARPGLEPTVHHDEAQKLATTQSNLGDRVAKIIERITELPEGSERFGNEIGLMQQVAVAMTDAKTALAADDTGSKSQAAETEAIELLLQCKRAGGGGGGGAGSSPGGGSTGTTQDAAIALLGSGLNQKEHKESRDVAQATGETGRILPEEYRAGLDSYFQRLEANK